MAKKYIVILTEKQYRFLQGEVMTEFHQCEYEHSRKQLEALQKKIDECIEV